MHPNSRAPFAYCKFRGFNPQENSPNLIVIRHKKVHGAWVYGNYIYDQAADEHFIMNSDGKFSVIPDTVGMQEPCSQLWPGDTCYCNGIRGVVRFGRHYDPTTYKREEVHFYLEWLGDRLEAAVWRTDLLHWAKQPRDTIIWAGNIWDPISEYRHLLAD